jgi:hypothetical protein
MLFIFTEVFFAGLCFPRELLGDANPIRAGFKNTLNQLTKADRSNATQYYVYDYQGNRVRSVVESNNQIQSQIG